MKPRRQRTHRGQVLVLLAISSVVLLAFVAMAVDVGYYLAQKRGAQNAADAAALAVARAMLSGETQTAALEATAEHYVAQNGYPDAAVSVALDTSDPDSRRVAVDVTDEVPKFFVQVVYSGDWQVRTHAVAALEPTPKDYALLALDTKDNPIDITGNVDIHVVDGGAMSNGGMKCVGNGRLRADLTVDAHTGFSTTGNCGFNGTLGSDPAAPIVNDPLAHVPPPPKPTVTPVSSQADCTETGTNPSRWICPPGRTSNGATASGNGPTIEFRPGDHAAIGKTFRLSGNNGQIIFNPGTYYFKDSTINLTGNNTTMVFRPGDYVFYMEDSSINIVGNSPGMSHDNSNVLFYFKDTNVDFVGNNSGSIPPGIYYFDGRGPRLTGNERVYGEDVLFFFDNGATWDSTGNTNYEFHASADPLYTGMQPHMLFYSARGSGGEFKMTGNSGNFLDGIVYLPSATLRMTGNSSGTWARGQLIVNRLSNVGNTDVRIDYTKYVDINLPAVWLIE